jgi:nicotinate-nucleotide--dimethylbenzimidazole phosphoribosyltransferase
MLNENENESKRISNQKDKPDFSDRKLRYGTNNFTRQEAMTRKEAEQAVETGIAEGEQMIEKGAACLIPADMGIANTTSSSAMLTVFCSDQSAGGHSFMNASSDDLVGLGTGIQQEQWMQKKDVIHQAIGARQPDPRDPIDVLSKVGGLEIGGMAGVILAGGRHRKPVLIDGFISTVAAIVATKLCPRVKDYLIMSHRSEEPGHRVALALLQKEPLLEMSLRLGEGSGAALAFPLLDAATRIVKEMATFESASVSNRTIKQG